MTILTPPPIKGPASLLTFPPIAPQLSGGGIPVPLGQFVPPNGFAGFAQQTSAVQSLYRRGKSSGGGRRRRKKAAKKAVGAAKRRVRRAAAGKAKKRLVKGSAAAKRYMAKIRRKRK